MICILSQMFGPLSLFCGCWFSQIYTYRRTQLNIKLAKPEKHPSCKSQGTQTMKLCLNYVSWEHLPSYPSSNLLTMPNVLTMYQVART
jgi:hypothetical protein